MDKQIKNCPTLKPEDIEQIAQVEQGLLVTADVSRADILVCCRLSDQRALVVCHAMPTSIASMYRQSAAGAILTQREQPLILNVLTNGSGGRQQREVLPNGAPIIQDVYPIKNPVGKVIGAFVVETNMIAYERQRGRNYHFRRAVHWLQEMCMRGEVESATGQKRFGIYDGIYLVSQERRIRYISGNATNLFRTAGVLNNAQGAHISMLEAADTALVEQAFLTKHCLEIRTETPDGRIWVRKAVPLRLPPFQWRRFWHEPAWQSFWQSNRAAIHAVLILVHNATEAEQKQRELNVKAAFIQEVHHRVKNNLQNIAAILRIQARRCQNEEARQHLTDAVNRVLSMSVIHEFLSQDEHRPINLRDVCQRIGNQVAQVSIKPEQEVEIHVLGPNIRLPASQATPAALVVNELLLNAVEHGLSEQKRGKIDIHLNDLGDSVELQIEDNGHGLPANFDAKQNQSLGLQIVHTLVTDDLKGKLWLESIYEPSLNGNDSTLAPTPVIPLTVASSTIIGARATVIFPKRSLGVD